MSRALRINTTVEVPSTYDGKIIEQLQNEVNLLIAQQEKDPEVSLSEAIQSAIDRLQQETEDKITWIIGILPSDVYKAALRFSVAPVDVTSKTVSVNSPTDEILTNMVRVGLKGFKNFKDADGNPVQFKTVHGNVNGFPADVVAPEVLQQIPWEHQVDIAEQVRRHNSIQSAKN